MTDYTEIEKLALEEVNKHAKIYEEAALFNENFNDRLYGN